ncbi:Hsp70 family protein [Paenibacillus barengoltzii]|uniref:Molecular chaperone DnaK n=1 Tax=Paenibacillus barengoltzii J12 TaxID=935846 RepID=A0ABY1LYF7_9BACL|nr:Hsp70 family protein [Paenibacillus barengoltzii]SMF33560.1 molecular chaperone DnaK [Paenibacillus barengoltzii J12]
MNHEFGIDFGTTNSACIGILDNRKIIKYTDSEDEPFPSVVMIDKITGEVICGREAWNQRQELSESCEIFTSIKSHLGTSQTWHIAGKIWTPEMIASQIFLGLKKQVMANSGKHVKFDSAVVAVPVGFSAEKRKSLREAARLAGIHIKSFVSESTAAAFHSYEKIKSFSKIAVFDWGGGTLDISILENSKGTIKEVAIGNEFLGGDDIDLKLAKYVHLKLEKDDPKNISFEDMPARFRDLMIARCESAKKEFTYKDVVNIRMNKYGEYGTVSININYQEFSRLIQPEISRALECLQSTLRKVHLNLGNLGCVLLVGGSVKLRPFIEKIEASWNCYKVYPEESDWSVSYGAAQLSIQEGKYILADSIGVLLSNGSFYPIAKAGTPLNRLDTTASFAIVEDTDTAHFIFTDSSGNVLEYVHVPTFGFFQEQVDVKLTVDENQVFRFLARSQKRSDKYAVEWHYTSPKLIYQLPVEI